MPTPDLGLPQMIEALDFGLKACLTRWCKDWDHSETKAQMNNPTEFASGGMRALEAGVVIELSVTGSATHLPMSRQDREHPSRIPRLGWPGLGEAAVEGNGVKYINGWSACDDQAFDKIEKVEFGPAVGQIRQIPAGRWRHLSLPPTVLQKPVPVKDPFDRACARQSETAFGLKLATDGGRPTFAQSTMSFKPTTQHNNAALHARRSPVGRTRRTTAAIFPIDPIKPSTHCPMKPTMSRANADSKTGGHDAKRRTPA